MEKKNAKDELYINKETEIPEIMERYNFPAEELARAFYHVVKFALHRSSHESLKWSETDAFYKEYVISKTNVFETRYTMLVEWGEQTLK